MLNIRRTAATVITVAALAAPTGVAATAHAAQPDGAKAVKGQTKQLLKDVAGKDKRLARLATSGAVTRLADDTETELVANIDEARAGLAGVKAAVEAADSTVDTRAARKELRSFRVENFRLVVNILRQSEGLAEAAATDAEAQAFLDQAEDAALAITATSTKGDVRAARALLRDAKAELEDETETAPTA
jgi:hypothetical protein